MFLASRVALQCVGEGGPDQSDTFLSSFQLFLQLVLQLVLLARKYLNIPVLSVPPVHLPDQK